MLACLLLYLPFLLFLCRDDNDEDTFFYDLFFSVRFIDTIHFILSLSYLCLYFYLILSCIVVSYLDYLIIRIFIHLFCIYLLTLDVIHFSLHDVRLRNCIGGRFATAEIVIVLAQLLSSFSVHIEDADMQNIRFEETVTCSPKDMFVHLTKRGD